jgi:O-antigen/teichoic acid export membrane protein
MRRAGPLIGFSLAMTANTTAHRNWLDIRRGARVNFVGIAARSLRGVYLVLVARLFGSEVLGLFLLGWNAVDVLSKIGLLGLDRGLVRFLPPLATGEGGVHLRSVLVRGALGLGLGASALTTVALWWLAPWLADIVFAQAAAVLPLRILALGIVPLSLTQVLSSVTRVERRMEYEVWTRSVIEPALLLVFAALFWWRGWGGAGLYLAQLLALGGGLVAAASFVVRHGLVTFRTSSSHVPGAGPLWREPAIRRMAACSAPVAVYDLIAMGVASLDFFLLARFVGPGTLGMYGAAREVAALVKKTRQSFEPVLVPVLAQEWQQDRNEAAHDSLDRVVRWILVLNVGFLLVVGLLGGDVLELFGSGFGAAAATLFILAFAHAVNGSWGVAENVVLLRRPAWNLWNWMAIALLGLGLNLLLIPRWGTQGAAISLASVFLAAALLRSWEAHHLVGWQPFRREALLVFLVALVVALPAHALIVNGPDSVIYRAVLTAAAILAYGSGVRPLTRRAGGWPLPRVTARSDMFQQMEERSQT